MKEMLRTAFNPIAIDGLGLRREDLHITLRGTLPHHFDDILAALGLDFIDLYLVSELDFTSQATLTDSWRTMHLLFMHNKIAHLGVSDCYLEHLARLIGICQLHTFTFPKANAIELNLVRNASKVTSYCRNHGEEFL